MAEYLFRNLAEEAGRANEFNIRSAGVAALAGDPAADQAMEVLGKKGITAIQEHRATPVHDELAQGADLILTMTQRHREIILQYYPEIGEKVFVLKEYTRLPEEGAESGYTLDIGDPWGQSVEVYEVCAEELTVHLTRLLGLL